MTKDVLQRAYLIERGIESLTSHKEELSNILKRGEFEFYIGNGYNSRFELIEEYLPKDFNNFIMDYIIRIDKKIAELEQEFKNL